MSEKQLAVLKRYQFQEGHPAHPNSGRPVGSRSVAQLKAEAEKLYFDALPFKAKQWIASEHPSTLIDARKLAIPDAEQPRAVVVVVAPDWGHLSAALRLRMGSESPALPAAPDAGGGDGVGGGENP